MMSNIPSIFDPYALNGEIDPHFGDPEPRLRSNTWPMPRPENWPKVKQENEDPSGTPPPGLELGNADGQLSAKKNSSRRNAWGNMSYADLITKAIQGSPDQRLTLSQIYDWMVRNVPYFKDKGDSNSSAGWKNSIRHNLSLHNRFMRVQNEGTGKSSWWVINPDAKPGKSTRRRAGSMDTPKYEKKRTRVKKKMEMLRSGLLDNTNSPTSSDGGDLIVDAFQLSVSDFRPRTSSNASSCSRLSPIPAIDADAPDNRVPPGMSPISWDYKSSSGFSSGVADQLTDTLTEAMKLNKSPMHELSPKASDPFNLDFCSPVAFPPSPAKFTDPSSPYSSFGSPYPATTLSSRTDGFQQAMSPAPQLTTLQQPRGQELLINNDPMMSSTALNRNKYGAPNHQQALSILTPVTVADSSISPGGLLESLKLEEQAMLPSDLDLPMGDLQGLDCDVNQVLQHEISVEGNLDFVDFENFGMVGQVPSTNTQSETTSGSNWVR